ncbi:MAG: DegQ family serine endoprotease [Gammaproteobacteria bacterium]|nr:DegQ family serine endoprotease [Gammaproteobacteria bacterium]
MTNPIALRLSRGHRRGALLLALLFAAGGLVTGQAATAGLALPLTGDGQSMPSLAPVIEEVSPSVVNIAVRGSVEVRNPFMDDPFFRRFFGTPEQGPGQRRRFQSAGSGVIVDAEQGYLITNHHVIENAEEITITLVDGRELTAEVIGSDRGSDVAVLKVEPKNLRAIKLADSDASRVGDFVVAIGNPFGLQHTVTSGIVSALGRSGLNPDGYEDFIQTDASINPGNSGGALINLRGELIGVNTAIFSARGGGNIGIGFAIPVNMARAIMDQIIEFGEVRRGLLGVNIFPVTPSTAEAYGLSEARGALVVQVAPGSAAEEAGVQIDDVIVSVNGRKIDDPNQLRNVIGLMRVGEQVRLEVIRDGRSRTLTATLQETGTLAADSGDAGAIDSALEGAQLANYTSSRPNYIGQDGVIVTEVTDGSPAAQRGLRNGDIILAVNRNRVRNLTELQAAIDGSGAVILRVRRGNQNLLVPIR